MNLLDLIKIIFKWRMRIMTVCLAAAVCSTLVSLLIPVYYKSTASFYASNPALTDRQTLFNTQGSSESMIEYFGSKKDIDRALSLAKSATLAAYIIHKFDLFRHYNVDTTKVRYYLTKVNEEFEDNYSPVKTDLGGVEITVYDRNPQMAADIANEIVRKIDDMNKAMIMENKRKIIRMFETNLETKHREVSLMSDSIANLKLMAGGHPEGKAGERLDILKGRLESAITDMNIISTLYEQHATSTSDEISTVYFSDVAFPAEKKSKPIRWLIVVSSILITFLLAIVAAVLIEKYHEIKPELYKAG